MPKNLKTIIEKINKKKGFTFIELMVTMAIASIVMAGIYAAYHAQLRSHVTQQAVVDIQQSLRGAMHYMQRSIRMAGFGGSAGLEVDFTAYDPDFDKNSGASTGANSIAFTIDDNEDGTIDINDSELIAFRLDANNNLQAWREDPDAPGVWNWETVAENIAQLQFRYFDNSIPPVEQSPPFTPAELATIRSIQISITGRAAEELNVMAADRRPQVLTTQLQCRNLGLP